MLLAMISYPSGGAPGLTEEAQRDFFLTLGRDVSLPPGIYASVFSGFDLPWKGRRPDEFAKPEYYVGLFDEKSRPKAAVEAIRKWPLVQQRP